MQLPYSIIEEHFCVVVDEEQRTARYLLKDELPRKALSSLIEESLVFRDIDHQGTSKWFTKEPTKVADHLIDVGVWQ